MLNTAQKLVQSWVQVPKMRQYRPCIGGVELLKMQIVDHVRSRRLRGRETYVPVTGYTYVNMGRRYPYSSKRQRGRK